MRVIAEVRRRLPWFLRRGGGPCAHLRSAPVVSSPADRCAECVAIGDTWFHLRQCLQCGRTACCDQSKNKHATAHFRATGHPVMRSAQPGESWRWCYLDERLVS